VRQTGVRSLLLAVLALALVACGDDAPADHGADVPGRAREALDCPGRPWSQGAGNYDTGPEDVQDDARKAVDDWLHEEGALLPDDIDVEEAGRQGREVLFTWSEGRDRLGALVAHEGMDGLDDHTGWGVASYAFCDPAFWPEPLAEDAGYLVWSNADGDRVQTAFVYSMPPTAEGCFGPEATVLVHGHEGRDGTYVGRPGPGMARFLRATYADRAAVPAGAADTGYRRDGRELWVTDQAAYLVRPDGDAERWPAVKPGVGCG
jgi:hypothetical protein